ncbi:suppressor of fused domain protein [Zavarzinella formosa]|uniref:suppressor of fused domain protein n=1 Tax=Zavarzinella formosa TaxID=360055 RepID=UPI0002E1AE5A|nr:suppressor of fused domain protein [Zavarzinella formosa]
MAETVESDEDPIVNAIGEHVTKHVGPVANVFQERAWEGVQIDVMIVPPSDGKDFITLVTCGMSERPMRVPLENPEDLGLLPELRYAELLLCLPPDWPFSPEAFQQEENYWPVRWLKKIARLPHLHQAWLGLGHTIPNGDPPQPLAENTGFAGWMIDQPLMFPPELQKLRLPDRVINFYSVVPLYSEEMVLKLKQGSGALSKRLDMAGVTELVDIGRVNTAK